MEPKHNSFLSRIIHAAQPWKLLAGFLFYALGVSIVYYLGEPIDLRVYALGQAGVTCFQASSYFLTRYYDAIRPAGKEARLYSPQERREVVGLLQIALSLLTVGMVMVLLLLVNKDISPGGGMVLMFIFALFLLYGVPPVRLVYSGYGELVEAIVLTNLVPAFGFALQYGSLHRLLGMITFPLTGLYLAMLIVGSFRSYSEDMKRLNGTLLIRIGWERGIVLHNVLILTAYLLIAAAALLGLPWGLTWPALLLLPLGAFQVWMMSRMADGAKPQWRLMTLAAVALPVLTAYFLIFSLMME